LNKLGKLNIKRMGAFLDKPKVEKTNEEGKGNEMEYAVSSMQGWRVDMEDSHTAKSVIPQLPNWSFFAVFDGHAGSKVAEHSSKELINEIMSQKYMKDLVSGKEQEDPGKIIEAVKESFILIDKKMRDLHDKMDGFGNSGSTSTCVLVSPTNYYFINCGDSRGLLFSDGKVTFATDDHKPSNTGEKERIEKAGGSVIIQRVNGSLAVSRALGDYDYKSVAFLGPKKQMVSSEPDVTTIKRDLSKDQFIVLACDGIFDVSTNDELGSFILSRLEITDNFTKICNDVVDLSLSKGSRDNMTLILLALPSCPKPTAQAKEAEEKLEKQLETLMKSIIEESNSKTPIMDFSFVYQAIQERLDEVVGLPPGGGLDAKRRYLETLFDEVCNSNNANGDGNNQNSQQQVQNNQRQNGQPLESAGPKP